MQLTRRKFLTGSASAVATAFFGVDGVIASTEDVRHAIEKFTGGRDIDKGVLKLTTPEVAQISNSVPISVLVESPMTADDYVNSIMILADGNPVPAVVTFNFSPLSGEAKASTRIRLARTQNVIAVARLSNGSIYQTSNNVTISIPGE